MKELIEAVQGSRLLTWGAAMAVVLAGVGIGMLARRLIRRIGHGGGVVESAVSIGARVVQSLVVALAVVLALDLLGVDLGPLLASAGVAGVIVGFALKDIAENYIAGIIMGFRRAFVIGDEIIVATEFTGRVEELSLRYARLRTRDGLRIYLPNSLLLKEPLVNLTRNGSWRGEFEIGIAYGTDLEVAREVAISAADGVEGIDHSSPAQAWVGEFGPSTISLIVRYWYDPDGSNKGLRSAVMIAVKKAFDAHGIEMPTQQLALRWQGGAPTFATDPGD